MGEALVAKSYIGLEQVTEPYSLNGKMYVKVRMKNGNIKQVRAYSAKEYAKYNPEVKVTKPIKSRREVLGFGEKGFIWIFKGETYENLDWFRASPCRYSRVWGWYLPSDIEMPDPIPSNVEPLKLNWDDVSFDGDLIAEDNLVKFVETLLYDEGESQHVGQIGDRLDFVATCDRASMNQSAFGISYFYVFSDEDKNIYTWGTSARVLEEGQTYHIRGTVKDHTTFRNTKQTALTRCKVEEM